MNGNRLELLRSMPVFGGLKTESLELILENADQIVLQAGDYFFREGEPGDSLFVLESGTILIERLYKGQPIEFGRLAHGDCFGEMALIDFLPRSAAVKAESNCEAIEVTNRALRRLFQLDVEQYAMIMMNLGREVSRRLRIADECLFQLQQSGQ
ncbi:MAG: cyclic nucleotide-binding domain-containing protein [Planctomycetota bacterium]